MGSRSSTCIPTTAWLLWYVAIPLGLTIQKNDAKIKKLFSTTILTRFFTFSTVPTKCERMGVEETKMPLSQEVERKTPGPQNTPHYFALDVCCTVMYDRSSSNQNWRLERSKVNGNRSCQKSMACTFTCIRSPEKSCKSPSFSSSSFYALLHRFCSIPCSHPNCSAL